MCLYKYKRETGHWEDGGDGQTGIASERHATNDWPCYIHPFYVDGRGNAGVGMRALGLSGCYRNGRQAMVHPVHRPLGGTGNRSRRRRPLGLTIELFAPGTTHCRPEHLGSSASRRRVTYFLYSFCIFLLLFAILVFYSSSFSLYSL